MPVYRSSRSITLAMELWTCFLFMIAFPCTLVSCWNGVTAGAGRKMLLSSLILIAIYAATVWFLW